MVFRRLILSAIITLLGCQAARTIHNATENNNAEEILTLASHGGDLNERNKLSWTPLHAAAKNGYVEAAEALVRSGADVRAKTPAGTKT